MHSEDGTHKIILGTLFVGGDLIRKEVSFAVGENDAWSNPYRKQFLKSSAIYLSLVITKLVILKERNSVIWIVSMQ